MAQAPSLFSADGYQARVEKQVPALQDVHLMVGLLLAETVPDEGCILALGAGGGMELKALRQRHPAWHFSAIDPSPEMIKQAEVTLDGDLTQIAFTQGYTDDAPEGPFDGATGLFVLHFLEPAERLRTLRQIHRRLKPGAPLVVAHHSFPRENGAEGRWLTRYADFQIARGLDPAQTRSGVTSMKDRLPALSPTQDEALLREAGFKDVELFYAALTFKGWIAYR
ncbi:class I SAM-dependent methyltransferase [Thalassospira alkalitolerans]|uniref:class I SAM-dependent methyltransferase n=1 Tax=Thalassospira alkalitolerans TaxID=1293890 RepID=UPI003AA7D419